MADGTAQFLPPAGLVLTEQPAPGMFGAIFRALESESAPLVGAATANLLVIPLHDSAGAVAGGLWGCTNFEWLHVQMLFVPAPLRGAGMGARLIAMAEHHALARGCRGAHVSTFSFQAAGFYEKQGYTLFGVLEDFPPGHSQLSFRKRFVPGNVARQQGDLAVLERSG